MDAWCTPKEIRARHLSDQLAGRGGDTPRSNSGGHDDLLDSLNGIGAQSIHRRKPVPNQSRSLVVLAGLDFEEAPAWRLAARSAADIRNPHGRPFEHACARRRPTGRRGETVTFNLLYIHARVGLGKTHLLQAIAWADNSMVGTPRALSDGGKVHVRVCVRAQDVRSAKARSPSGIQIHPTEKQRPARVNAILLWQAIRCSLLQPLKLLDKYPPIQAVTEQG